MAKKTCFVLMGFGEKTDYRTQRKLDLDKTYKIIRAAVEKSGLECIRADDIIHSGVIDKPMYEQLLEADIAIADLSTSNENAIYELGVRHALKPHTTIVIAESEFKFPFDLSHLLIRHYQHLGTGIDFEEADRLKSELEKAINTLLAKNEVDSPVYTFLTDLNPPKRDQEPHEHVDRVPSAPFSPGPAGSTSGDSGSKIGAGSSLKDVTFTVMLEAYHEARSNNDFPTAITLISKLRKLQPGDPYLIQQHALVTYKSKLPDPLSALNEAKDILQQKLAPRRTNDPETLGIWGAIHKRLWELEHDPQHLDEAIASYERGFYLRRDYYNGINYAYLLNVRANIQSEKDEAIADRIIANRVRQQILDIVDTTLDTMPKDMNGHPEDRYEAYWLGATRLEALQGLGKLDKLEQEKTSLFNKAPENWMKDSTEEQLSQLKKLL